MTPSHGACRLLMQGNPLVHAGDSLSRASSTSFNWGSGRPMGEILLGFVLIDAVESIVALPCTPELVSAAARLSLAPESWLYF